MSNAHIHDRWCRLFLRNQKHHAGSKSPPFRRCKHSWTKIGGMQISRRTYPSRIMWSFRWNTQAAEVGAIMDTITMTSSGRLARSTYHPLMGPDRPQHELGFKKQILPTQPDAWRWSYQVCSTPPGRGCAWMVASWNGHSWPWPDNFLCRIHREAHRSIWREGSRTQFQGVGTTKAVGICGQLHHKIPETICVGNWHLRAEIGGLVHGRIDGTTERLGERVQPQHAHGSNKKGS